MFGVCYRVTKFSDKHKLTLSRMKIKYTLTISKTDKYLFVIAIIVVIVFFLFLSDASQCPNNGKVSGANGSFTSPRFPFTYPVSVKCTWVIEVPEDHQVQLTFPTFQLETCAISSLCTCDHVQVRDGQFSSSNKLKTLCGDEQPPTVRSSGRYMWVEFESDSKTARIGFNASFKAVRK